MDSVLSAVEAIMSFKSSSSAAPSECNVDLMESVQPILPVKKKVVMEGMNTGKFTSEEVRKFEEGLELYGRDWPKLVQHIGTRDSHSIRSHAQKYFIKLYRDNRPLPAKVAETGLGYTLSGKPLDPESAAAKPYLRGYRRSSDTAGFEKIKNEKQQQVVDKENESVQDSKSPVKKPKRKSFSQQPQPPQQVQVQQRVLLPDSSELDPETLNVERTDYSKSRPVRLSAKPKMETLTFNGYEYSLIL